MGILWRDDKCKINLIMLLNMFFTYNCKRRLFELTVEFIGGFKHLLYQGILETLFKVIKKSKQSWDRLNMYSV